MFLPVLLVVLQGDLLPEGPKGWRSERLELPLDFAPELDLEGVEELRFAPGMFTPDSSTYFSYAFAIRLAGRHEVDEAFLESFLTTYYRGLCRAVGAERFPDLDPGSVSASVEDDGGRLVARVDLYDAFTDGRALDLRIEVDVQRGPRTTEFLGLASPLEDEAVWSELHGIRERWLAARPAPLLLNHVFAVVDEPTWEALMASETLRGLATFEERTTVRGDFHYTGLYLYGRETYFEFLQPNPQVGLEPGRAGVGFGFDRTGAVDTLAQRLEERGLNAFPGAKTRELDGTSVPWFRILGLEMPAGPPLDVFAMEYDPRFLGTWHAEPGSGGITRRAVLQRYRRALGQDLGPLRDVIAVDLALNDEGRARLIEAAPAFGFEAEVVDGIQVLRTPDAVVRLHPAEPRAGLLGFDLALREPVAQESLELGAVTVRFEGADARVTLGAR